MCNTVSSKMKGNTEDIFGTNLAQFNADLNVHIAALDFSPKYVKETHIFGNSIEHGLSVLFHS